ncbi:hypothetical protein OTU49_002068 [Cherax quadricarinatus]|uniref:DNA repair protein REV1 n=2 Tax=Cherax quadricarinatus TaxID=27406 RepID=A0AAW0XRD0_CHEQU
MMSGRGCRGSRRGRRHGYGPTGFEEAGGYMAAKIAKLQNQYHTSVTTTVGEENRGIFKGVAIFVNGYTEPTAEELKRIMMTNGGTYHHYFSRSKTTHIIANNLPDTKIKNMNTDKIVSPKWVIDSLEAGHLLDYTKYILYTNQSKSQPKLPFKPLSLPHEKSEASYRNSPTTCTSEKNSSLPDAVAHQKIYTGSPIEESLNLHVNLNLNKTKSDVAAQDKNGFETHISDKRKLDGLSCHGLSTAGRQNYSPTKVQSMSTANPRFLSEFYNNSRLHHISTMGAMFKQYVNELQSQNKGFTGREGLMKWVKNNEEKCLPGDSAIRSSSVGASKKKSKRTVMHIDMDCFFVSVGLRKHPELLGKPIAVTHVRGNPRSSVREGVDAQYELNYYKERAKKRLQAKIHPVNSTKLVKVVPEIDENDKNEVNMTGVIEVVSASNGRFSTMKLIDDTCSWSEIASCSYEARKAGVKNGMFLGPALKLCPNLQTIPYDFDGYKEVSYKLYDIVASFTHDIEAVSCDEMFVDLTELLCTCQVTPDQFATYLREKIQAATGCPCSVGMGPSILVARMATRRAKPNGQYVADPEDLANYMKDHKVSELPGVGWSLETRLQGEGIYTCGDLQAKTLGQLQAAFGSRTGQSLFNYCQGIDDRLVKSEHVRKSVSAEVNYGIRFTCQSDADKFISELAVELENRLDAVKLKGKCITLKLKVRAKDAPVETAKFMGHGVCDNIAKSVSISSATSSSSIIEREALSLLHQVKVQPQDFRGVGIQVSRLEGHQGSSGGFGSGGTSIKNFLIAKSSTNKTVSPSISPINSTATDHTTFEDNKFSHINVGFCHLKQVAGEKIHSKTPGALLGSSTAVPAPSGDAQVSLTNETSQKDNIDLEVLMALPKEIRDQVIAEYSQQGYIIPTLGDGVAGGDRLVITEEPKPSTSGYVQPAKKSSTQESDFAKVPRIPGKGTLTSHFVELSGGNDLEDFIAVNESGKDVPYSTKDDCQKHSERRSSGNLIATATIAEEADCNSNSSLVSEDAQNEALITSFSQVDESFLKAIPEELREELRQDFKRQKEAAVNKQQRPQRTDAVCGGGLLENSSRSGRTLPQQQLGSLGNSSTIKAVTAVSKKRNVLRKSKMQGKGANPSPSKQYIHPRRNHLILENKNINEVPVSSKPSTSWEENIEDTLIEVDKEVPNLCGVEEISEVKSLIREWVSSCSHPEAEDADILAHYYTSLISHHDLEKLDLLIKHLYRQVLGRQNEFWESAYRTVIGRVQVAMLTHHNIKLKVLNL